MAEEQRIVHIITEILAIPLGIFLIWVGYTIRAKKWIRTGLIIAGIGNIVIDGYLIWSWF